MATQPQVPQQTLAQMVRAKYPGQYDDLNDVQLEQKVLAKYPEYGDLPRTTPPPAPNAKTTLDRIKQGATLKEALDPYFGFAKGVGQTVATTSGLINKIPGIGETLAPSQGVQAMQQAVQPTNTAQQIGKAAETVGEMAVPVGGGGAKAAAKAIDAVPSAERAGKTFSQVMQAAGDVPVSLNNSSEAALRLMDWQKKAQLGPTINKFLNRITNPNLGPLTYQEGRDFYQLLGRLSADETSKLAPAIRKSLTEMVVGLKTDLGNAAGSVGAGTEYYNAMKEYSQAAKFTDMIDKVRSAAGEEAARALIRGLGLGVGGAIGYAGYKAYTGR